MDANIKLKQFVDNIKDIRRDNTFFRDLVSLNTSDQFDVNEANETNRLNDQNHDLSQEVSLNLMAKDLNNFCDSSLQVLDDNWMDTCLTPSLQMKANVSQRNKLFAFHNKKQLFVNNFCLNEKFESKENMEIDANCMDRMDNTLGLSPLKRERLQKTIDLSEPPNISIGQTIAKDNGQECGQSSQTISSVDGNSLNLDGISFNNFSMNGPQITTDSLVLEESFRSIGKCSDLELRQEPKFDVNNTFRSPNSNFDNKSIEAYFGQRSEPISSFQSSMSTQSRIDFSLMNESFSAVSDEIDLSNNTLEIANKLIDRKNRKRKSIPLAATETEEISFTPSVNSTLNSNEDESDKAIKTRSEVSSGFGTISTVQQTYAISDTRSVQICALQSVPTHANTLSLNHLLTVSPNTLSVTIGCFVNFKLNYLKIRNLSVTTFLAEIKLNTNVDTLNSLDVEYPKQAITIPALYDGLLTDQIAITPLKSGHFQVVFQIYPKIENINLPISPISVMCDIRAEELVIKRPLYTSDLSTIDFNLFEDSVGDNVRQSLNLVIANKRITNDIPLKLFLNPSNRITFDPIHQHLESAIHAFRCSDANTMFVSTKTQYEMQIPIRIQSSGARHCESSLIVSTDSLKSHVLAIIRLRATFWPRKQLSKPLLQCSESTITLRLNKWKAIHFRNKSESNLIKVIFRCSQSLDSDKDLIRLSSNQLMLRPLEKASIGLLAQQRAVIDGQTGLELAVTYESGVGTSFAINIPIEVTL